MSGEWPRQSTAGSKMGIGLVGFGIFWPPMERAVIPTRRGADIRRRARIFWKDERIGEGNCLRDVLEWVHE